MKYISTTLLLLVLCTPTQADTTFVDGSVSGVWDIDGSPYIANNCQINRDQQLIIEPGVEVFAPSGIALWPFAKLIAVGTEDDSIYFKPLQNDSWGHLEGQAHSTMWFEYCSFQSGGGMDMGAINSHSMDSLVIRHSIFIECYMDVTSLPCNYLSMSDCLLSHRRYGFRGIYAPQTKRLDIKRCVFIFEVGDYVGDLAIDASFFNATISNCLFDNSSIRLHFQNDTTSYLIENNIFRNPDHDGRFIHFERDAGLATTVANNYFLPVEGAFAHGWPEGAAVVDRVNINGDSCDVYGNIFLDPGLNERWQYPDPKLLLEDSPCIDAGREDSPLDPDSTIADIGPFFYPQQNIALDTLLVHFEPIPFDARATAPFSIRNRGVRRALRVFIDEELLQPPFYLFSGGDTLEIAPGEAMEFEIEFHPEAEGQFRDSVLIHSDDRHDSLLVLYVEAEAYNGVADDGLEIRPTEFKLLAVYPNPFNSSTTISISLPPVSTSTSLLVYGLDGRLADKMDLGRLLAGEHKVVWNACDLAAGVYVIRFEAGESSVARKVVLVR